MWKTFLALLALLWAVSAANATSLTLTGAGGAPGVSTPATLTFVGHTNTPTGSGTTTLTYSSANIGNPAYIATRRVIIVPLELTSTRTLTACTINGVSCDTTTNFDTTCAGCHPAIGSAVVTSGTTGVTIVLTINAADFNQDDLAIYTVDNSLLSSSSPVCNNTFASGVTSVSTTLNIPANVAVLGMSGNTVGFSSGVWSPNDPAINSDFLNFQTNNGHANGVSANASAGLGMTWTGSGNGVVAECYYH